MIHRADLRIFEIFQENVRDEEQLLTIKAGLYWGCALGNVERILE